MFSPIEKEALRIILGMNGEQPRNIAELGIQLFPDVDPAATSLDARIQRIKGVLSQRSRASERSMYFLFYRKKRYCVEFKHKHLLPEDIAFLEEVFQQCSTWLAFREKVHKVLEGSSLKTGVRVREK